MDWLLRAGSFRCLRFDCPKDVTPERRCSRCEMPWLDKRAEAAILLHKRCRENKVLPEPGGLLDQSETTLRDFDVIDHMTRAYQKEQREQDEMALKAKTMKGLHG